MNAHAEAACTAAAFENRYQSDPDPWNFAQSAYERGRYGIMLGTLGRARYDSAYEPGCSIGEFTVLLAQRCSRVFATDISPTAVAAARQRCAPFPHVEITVGALPDRLPAQRFDLIIFSELGYYFCEQTLRLLGSLLFERLLPGGEFMAVNWLGNSADHMLHGNEVSRILRDQFSSRPVTERVEEAFRIDLWRRT